MDGADVEVFVGVDTAKTGHRPQAIRATWPEVFKEAGMRYE